MLACRDGATDVRRGGDLLGIEGMSRLLEPLAGRRRALAREAQTALLEWGDGPIGDDVCLLVLRPEALSST